MIEMAGVWFSASGRQGTKGGLKPWEVLVLLCVQTSTGEILKAILYGQMRWWLSDFVAELSVLPCFVQIAPCLGAV